jgi:hypothetical protein
LKQLEEKEADNSFLSINNKPVIDDWFEFSNTNAHENQVEMQKSEGN